MSLPSRSLSGWHPEDVKAAIRKRGETLTSLAEKKGFDGSYLRHVLNRPLRKGEAIIAKFLGVEPREIWPARYRAKITPKQSKAKRRAHLRVVK